MAKSITSLLSPQSRAWVPNLVLVASVVLTLVCSFYMATEAEAKDRLRFENAVGTLGESIQRRVELYIALLDGARGLFMASEEVTRDEFRSYVESLDIAGAYPGVQGIGFAARVDESNRDAIVALAREGGIADFKIWPDGGAEAPYTTILYLEPLDRRNRAAIGYDMHSDPVRRAAMERARDTGLTTVSGRVTLVQEIDSDTQPGFVVYTPVFAPGRPTGTPEERREALVGFVYSPFRTRDLLGTIFRADLHPTIDVSLYDDASAASESELFSAGTLAGHRPRFRGVGAIVLPGRTWTMVSTTTPEFERASGRNFSIIALGLGLAISFLLFLISRSQVDARARAERIALDLGRSEEALRASEYRLRRLVDSNIVGIAMFEVDGNVREANDAFLRIIGYSRGELLAGAISLERLTPPDREPLDAAAFAELEQTGAKAPFETAFLRRDGTRVPVLQGLAHLGGAGSNMAVGFVIDLTERKRADRERAHLLVRERRAREIAEEANRLKDEFLATVSHELRTPLNAILGWARLLRTHAFDAAKTEQALETIERNARAQAQLVEDLLDVSRIVTGKLRMKVRPVDVVSVVEAALEAVKPAATAKGVELRAELDRTTGTVTGDGTRLQQVVWNLLSNAVKFTDRGGAVTVRLRAVDTYAEIAVSDTGAGMSPKFLPYVFDRFRQEDSSITRAHGGLGLGLTIVRSLVEMHGGTVSASSDGEGAGATFVVRLPLIGLKVDAESVETAPPSDPIPLDGLRILVVDDDPDARDVLAATLEQHGAKVLSCFNATQALEALEVWHPDVLISDVAMPGGDGHELIRRIRKLRSSMKAIPAIALSAYTRTEDRRRSIAAGYREHLAKPFDPATLVESVGRVLRKGARKRGGTAGGST